MGKDRITEHDRYHKLLLTYYSEGKGKKREVAAAFVRCLKVCSCFLSGGYACRNPAWQIPDYLPGKN
jgi:hypothetical protein